MTSSRPRRRRPGLRLKPGDSYRLVGSTAQTVKFGMAARLGLSGVDLLVNQATSARLGLVRQVAGLISAPGASLPTLTRQGRRRSSARAAGSRSCAASCRSPRFAPGTGAASYLQLFKASAALYCPGLSWTVLAAIGQIESADGTNVGPSSAGALGPMQFLPSTWAHLGNRRLRPDRPAGRPESRTTRCRRPRGCSARTARPAAAQSLSHAIFDYNHADWYVSEVLALAAEYAADYR